MHIHMWLNWTIGEAKLAAFLVIFMKLENLLLLNHGVFLKKSQIVFFQIISGAFAKESSYFFYRSSGNDLGDC